MLKYLTTLSVYFTLLLANSASSADKSFIWPDFKNGTSIIYYSEFENGQWGPREVIVDDGKRNDSPAIATDNAGNQLAVWSYSVGNLNKVAYRYRPNKGDWSEVSSLETGLKNNLSPTLTVDSIGHFWMFWVASDKVNKDNIYATYFYNNNWQNLTNISNNNDSHDFDPNPEINANNQLQVSWHYMDEDYYRQSMTKTLVQNQWVEVNNVATMSRTLNTTNKVVDDVAGEMFEEDVNLPPFYDESTAGYGSLTESADPSSKSVGNKSTIKIVPKY